MLHLSFHTIYLMHHEATACHVAAELQEVLDVVASVLRAARNKFSDKQCTSLQCVPPIVNAFSNSDYCVL